MRWIAVLLILLAPMALAQPRTVLSGAHDGYSRLVLPVTPGQDWQAGRTEQGYALTIPGADRFDLSRIFDRIGRDRIDSIDQTGDRLLIGLACDCHLVLSTDGPGWLVADVRDGPAPPGHPWEQPVETGAASIVRAGAPVLPIVTESVPWLDMLPSAPAAGLPGNSDLAMPQVATPAPELSAALADAMPPAAPPSPPADTPMAAADAGPDTDANALTQSLAQAVAQGFLTPAAPLPHQLPAAAEPAPIVPPEVPPPAAPLPQPAGLPGLTARTSAERDSLLAGATEGPDRCLPDAALAVQDWVATDDFAAEIGQRRAALTSERDLINDRAPELLAQAYVYFGFGAEARAALALAQGRTAERDVLDALARIVDGHAPPTPVLDDQAGCIGAVALWAALAHDDIAPLTPAERDAAMLALRALPPALAAQLGPRLARLHLTTGDSAAARDVLDVALPPTAGETESPPPADTGLAMLEADLQFIESGPDAAISALGRIADGDVRMDPSALLRLVNLTLQQGDVPTEAHVGLLAAMRFERRGTDVVPDLLAAEFAARLAQDNFAAAQDLLADATEPDATAMAQDFALAATERMSVDDFVTFAFGEALPDNPGPDGGNAVAARLIDLGFAPRAADILTPPVMGAAMAERRLLRAAAEVAMGHGAAALATLDGMSGDRTAALRAAAWRLQGDEAAALAALGATGRDDAAAATIWRAGDFTSLALGEDPLLQQAALAANSVTALPDDVPALAARGALLSEAESTRALAAALLDRFALPAVSD